MNGLAKVFFRESKQSETAPRLVVILYRDGHIILRSHGQERCGPAVGHWPGAALVPMAALKLAMTGVNSGASSMSLTADGASMKIGDVTLKPRFMSEPPKRIDLAVNAPTSTVLKLLKEHGAEAMEEQGLGPVVKRAINEREARIHRATEALKTCKVPRREIERIVDRGLEDVKIGHHEGLEAWLSHASRAWVVLAPLGVNVEAIRELVLRGFGMPAAARDSGAGAVIKKEEA